MKIPVSYTHLKDPVIFYKVILCAILFGLVSKVFAEITHFLKKAFSDKIQNTSVKSFIGGIIIIILILLIGNRMYLGPVSYTHLEEI